MLQHYLKLFFSDSDLFFSECECASLPLSSVSEFPVTVQQSEASVRCSLQGAYWLQVGEDMLVLKDIDSKQRVLEWPYKLLRRYGRDKVSKEQGDSPPTNC